MSAELKGQMALMTGAAAARELARQGAAVVLTDVIDGEGRALARELQAENRKVVRSSYMTGSEAHVDRGWTAQ